MLYNSTCLMLLLGSNVCSYYKLEESQIEEKLNQTYPNWVECKYPDNPSQDQESQSSYSTSETSYQTPENANDSNSKSESSISESSESSSSTEYTESTQTQTDKGDNSCPMENVSTIKPQTASIVIMYDKIFINDALYAELGEPLSKSSIENQLNSIVGLMPNMKQPINFKCIDSLCYTEIDMTELKLQLKYSMDDNVTQIYQPAYLTEVLPEFYGPDDFDKYYGNIFTINTTSNWKKIKIENGEFHMAMNDQFFLPRLRNMKVKDQSPDVTLVNSEMLEMTFSGESDSKMHTCLKSMADGPSFILRFKDRVVGENLYIEKRHSISVNWGPSETIVQFKNCGLMRLGSEYQDDSRLHFFDAHNFSYEARVTGKYQRYCMRPQHMTRDGRHITVTYLYDIEPCTIQNGVIINSKFDIFLNEYMIVYAGNGMLIKDEFDNSLSPEEGICIKTSNNTEPFVYSNGICSDRRVKSIIALKDRNCY